VRRQIQSVLEKHTRPGQRVLLAVSGGADSLALAAACKFVARKLELSMAACVVDHGLQTQSAKVAAVAKQRLQEIGIQEVSIKKVQVNQKGNLEAAAREARYQALESGRKELGADFILLGHTLDDQAEAVLLGLARGSGARSLAGIRERNGKLLRPMLGISRNQVEKFLADEGISYWSDPHNKDLRFLRVLIRKKVLPFLEKTLGPGVAISLVRSAGQLRMDDDYLTGVARGKLRLATKALNQSVSQVQLSVEVLEKLDPAILHRVVKLALDEFGRESSSKHLSQVVDLVLNWHGQKPLSLPGVRVIRKGNIITIRASQET
jgi:tRNA(Ile)-lysidine synthase